MKTKILIFVFFLFAGNLSAQYDDDYTGESRNKTGMIQRGDNLITISTNQPAQTNFTEFGMHLVDNGFTFKTKDLDFMQLSTDPKRCENGLHYAYAMNITFRDNAIIIRVKQSGMSAGAAVVYGDAVVVWNPWHYATSSGNIMNQSFMDFYPILKSYNYPVTFSTE